MIQSYRKFETTVLVRMGSWPFGHSQLPRRIFLGWGAQKLTPLDAHTEGTPAACSRMEGGGVNPLSQHLLRDAHTMSSTSWLLGSRQPHRHHANPQESHSLVKEAHTCSLSLSHTHKHKKKMILHCGVWLQGWNSRSSGLGANSGSLISQLCDLWQVSNPVSQVLHL